MFALNALFVGVTYFGMGWTQMSPSNNIISKPECIPGTNTIKELVVFHITSFVSFVMSNVVAIGIKIVLESCTPTVTHSKTLRVFMVLCAVLSVSGYTFMFFAMNNVAQIKLGLIECGDPHMSISFISLLVHAPVVFSVYTTIVVYIFHD